MGSPFVIRIGLCYKRINEKVVFIFNISLSKDFQIHT